MTDEKLANLALVSIVSEVARQLPMDDVINQSNQSSLRLLITPLTRTQMGLQEQEYKHEK